MMVIVGQKYKYEEKATPCSANIDPLDMNFPLSLAVAIAMYAYSNPLANAQLLGGVVPALCTCSAGTYCAVVLGCAPCDAGSSSEAGSTSCSQCPAVSQHHLRCTDLTDIAEHVFGKRRSMYGMSRRLDFVAGLIVV
jgi:hypothetical protein